MRSGKQYLEALKDERRIFLGTEQINDVTAHPAFAATAKTLAGLYESKHKDKSGLFTDKAGKSVFFEKPSSKEDLARRTAAHDSWATSSFGLLGRSPDCLAACVTGLTLDTAAYDRPGGNFSANIRGYYQHLADNDLFGVCVLQPVASRRGHRDGDTVGGLTVVRETDRGLVVNGAKGMATGAIFADEIFIGTNFPLTEADKPEAITCAVPVSTAGLTLHVRRPMAPQGGDPAQWPLASRFDEEDATLVFDNVEIPWERVFAYGEPANNSEFLGRSPALAFKVHHANVRFRAKLRAILGIAFRLAQANGSSEIPAVRELLGRLAGYEANLDAMIRGQTEACEATADGNVFYNRRMVMGTQAWCQDTYGKVTEAVRQLSGSGVFQLPASADVFANEKLAANWDTPSLSAAEAMRLHLLAWDMLGSEFAMRQAQYENFYAGPPHKLATNNFKACPWETFAASIDRFTTEGGATEH